MIRKIIQIDEDKCNGCGACAAACHEGAIGMVNGKAKLLRDDYCDGLGNCLPACPTDAIHFIEREAAEYDEAAAIAHKANKENNEAKENKENTDMEIKAEGGQQEYHGCPGSRPAVFSRKAEPAAENVQTEACGKPQSQLAQWPCQIKLAPVNASYFNGAKLLIAADCTAYAYASMHQDFMKGKVTLIGCPKLDDIDYSEKLTDIITENDIKSLTIVRMEVPCCGGIEYAATKALQNSGKFIPWQVVTISIDGKILD